MKERILIVDDKMVSKVVLAEALKDTYEIVEAENGQETTELQSAVQSSEDLFAGCAEMRSLLAGCENMELKQKLTELLSVQEQTVAAIKASTTRR